MRIRHLFRDENSRGFCIPLNKNRYFEEKNTNRKKISGGNFFLEFLSGTIPGCFQDVSYGLQLDIKNYSLLEIV